MFVKAGSFLGEGTLSAQCLYMFSVHNRGHLFIQEIMGNCARGWGYKTDSAIRWLYTHAPIPHTQSDIPTSYHDLQGPQNLRIPRFFNDQPPSLGAA